MANTIPPTHRPSQAPGSYDLVRLPASPVTCRNLIGGRFVPAVSGDSLEVRSPYTGSLIGYVGMSGAADVEAAVSAARAAWPAWQRTPLRERAELALRFRELLLRHRSELANWVACESGKTRDEAAAAIQRGIEIVDFAASLPNSQALGALEVARGVTCEYRREPLGVVVGITPFNFPAMVPLWMLPIALTVGNAFILKPSEKVPLSACRLGELIQEAGYPAGVFSIVHGGRQTAEALVQNPHVRAVAFVGSTPAARSVYLHATSEGKRALCLGGAKNHLIVMPDADPAITVKAVFDSFTGCAGQRCMAASVLVAVGASDHVVHKVSELAARTELGAQMGALIDRAARERILQAIGQAEKQGARILADGRNRPPPPGCDQGNWVGPTVLDHVTPDMDCARRELFGPVLCVIRVKTLDEALALERQSNYGNATSVFTQSGAIARYVSERATSGMIGVNVGVPVPRDPFSFGGTKESKFGHGDITGPSAVDFWSELKKITTKWALQPDATWTS